MQLGDEIEDVGDAADDAVDEVDALKRATEQASVAAKEHIDRLREQADALDEQADAMRSSADATFAAEDAQDDFAEAARRSAEVQADGKKSTDEKAAAVKRERDAMLDAAAAAEKKAEADATAAGRTATQSEKLDAFNKSLLQNAKFATPAAREQITRYIAEANKIPPEKATEILALVAEGKLAEAEAMLNEASATRDAYIQAEATNVAATEAELNRLARERVARIVARNAGFTDPSGQTGRRASGGPARAGEPYWVGDRFGVNSPAAELFVPDQHGQVYNQSQLARAASSAGQGPIVVNVTNNGRDLRPDDVARAINGARLQR